MTFHVLPCRALKIEICTNSWKLWKIKISFVNWNVWRSVFISYLVICVYSYVYYLLLYHTLSAWESQSGKNMTLRQKAFLMCVFCDITFKIELLHFFCNSSMECCLKHYIGMILDFFSVYNYSHIIIIGLYFCVSCTLCVFTIVMKILEWF